MAENIINDTMTTDNVEDNIDQEIEEDVEEDIVYTQKNKKWHRDDIETLYYMSIQGNTISEMCRELNRSRKSIIQALKRIQTQQALFHPMHEIASLHNADLETFAKRLIDPLFYIPFKVNQTPMIIVASVVIFGLVSLYGNFFYNV